MELNIYVYFHHFLHWNQNFENSMVSQRSQPNRNEKKNEEEDYRSHMEEKNIESKKDEHEEE